jgi:outer membrane protein assembly factor BamE (lipoprotein component of BamABCDE complex)
MARNFVTLAFCVLLVGCAASGVKVTEAQISALRAGETTVDQVLAQFGQPTTRMKLADGTVTLLYVYSEAKVRGATFIPIVGAFAGGMDVRSTSATLRFNSAGLLLDVSSSQSELGSGTGAAAGAVETTPLPQPRQ